MTERSAQSFGDEARDTIVKSSLTGVAATMLAVTIFSPAGFGGMIGVSSAFGGGNATAAPENPYAVLPAFAPPLTEAELDAIQTQLAQSTVSMEITRAATDDRIENLRVLAMDEGVVTFAPTFAAAQPSRAREDLRLSLSEPVSVEAPVMEAIAPTPISYGGADMDRSVPYRDPHLELAELFLAHETY